MAKSGTRASFHRARPLAAAAWVMCVPAALAYLLLAPPAKGQMLVLPVTAEARGALIRIIDDPAVQLMGRGPTDGSMIVMGERGAIRRLAGEAAILVLAVPDAGCIGAG